MNIGIYYSKIPFGSGWVYDLRFPEEISEVFIDTFQIHHQIHTLTVLSSACHNIALCLGLNGFAPIELVSIFCLPPLCHVTQQRIPDR